MNFPESFRSEQCKSMYFLVDIVDLVKSFPTSSYLQKSASIQPRASLSKFGGTGYGVSTPPTPRDLPGQGVPLRYNNYAAQYAQQAAQFAQQQQYAANYGYGNDYSGYGNGTRRT